VSVWKSIRMHHSPSGQPSVSHAGSSGSTVVLSLDSDSDDEPESVDVSIPAVVSEDELSVDATSPLELDSAGVVGSMSPEDDEPAFVGSAVPLPLSPHAAIATLPDRHNTTPRISNIQPM
jgi:hypothetical protein